MNDLADLRVLAHPLRLRLLSLLTGEALSAAEAARALGETQANVSYHLRRLDAAGLVDLVEVAGVRGGTAKRYRHDPSSGERLATTGGSSVLTALGDRLRSLAPSHPSEGALAFTDAEVWVDEGEARKILGLTRQVGVAVHEAALPASSPGAVRLAVLLAAFETRETRA